MENMPYDDKYDNAIQQAVSRRLSRLGSMPVDTRRLDEALRQQIDRPAQALPMWLWWTTPLAGVAAALIIVLVMVSSSAPRLSAKDLAGVYSHLATSRQPNTGMAAMNNMAMNCRLMPGEMATCCRQTIGDKKMACMVIRSAKSRPVVLVACSNRRAKMPVGRLATIAGHIDIISKSGDVNMVMRKAGSHWFCAMGTQSPAVLGGYLNRAALK